MKFRTRTSKFSNVPIALVFATLISLCISNNVGPSFLPLPFITTLATENRFNDHQDIASNAPSSPAVDSLRVPMVAQSQTRGDKDQTAQTLAATLKSALVLDDQRRVISESDYQISRTSSRSVLQPPGRAPPSL